MWLHRQDFMDVVRRCWDSDISGYGMYRFTSKLRVLKKALREWNAISFGDVFQNMRDAEAAVKTLEQIFSAITKLGRSCGA